MEFTQADLSRAYMACKALQAYKNLFDTLPKPNTGSVSAGAIPKAKSWLKPADAVRFYKATKQGKLNIAYELKTTVQLLNAEVDKIMESDYTMFEGDRISRIVNLGPHVRINPQEEEYSLRGILRIASKLGVVEEIVAVIGGAVICAPTQGGKRLSGEFTIQEGGSHLVAPVLLLLNEVKIIKASSRLNKKSHP